MREPAHGRRSPAAPLAPLLVFAALAACANGGAARVVRGHPIYEGARRPRAEVAVVQQKRNWKIKVTIDAIDGVELTGNAWEVLPGNHTIAMSLKTQKTISAPNVAYTVPLEAGCAGSFRAVAGATYLTNGTFEWEANAQQATFDAWVKDAATGSHAGRVDCIIE